jgi:hypothetical protein
MNPHWASRGSIERHDGVGTCQNIHHSVDHNGVKQIFAPIAGWITPRNPQLADV